MNIDPAYIDRQRAWSRNAFGPGSRRDGIMDHICSEFDEIRVASTSEEEWHEWCDVIILALDGAWRAGASPQEIIGYLHAKQEINFGRTFPDWRTVPPGVRIEHDRSGE